MKMMKRDIEVMGWILEQKFMTERQVREVFFEGISARSREAYKRLYELQKNGYLKTSKRSIYRHGLYLVTASGLQQLRAFCRDRGLGELVDADYSNYKHDIAVTDIRIIFHELGYTDWVAERIMSKRGGYRRLSDGAVHHHGKYFAIEYESSQKSRGRYREIFYNYDLDENFEAVIYIVDTPEFITKIQKEALNCPKVYFAVLEDFCKDRMDMKLSHCEGTKSLHRLLEG
jgi:hypothetical protein